MEVDPPRPDVAAARHGDGGLAETRHQGPHDDDAGAHGAHELVGSAATQAGAGVHAQDVAVAFRLRVRAERAQHRHHRGHVGDPRDAADDAGVGGEQAGGEQLEGGVLGPREDYLSLQTPAAAHLEARVVFARAVHQTLCSIAVPGDRSRQRGASGDVEAVLGALERLLGAEVVHLGLRAQVAALLHALAGADLRLLGARHVDGAGELAVVDHHEHLVEEHLRVADAGGDVVPVVADGADARLADGEQRHHRLVPRQDAELAVDAGKHDHGDVPGVHLPVGRDDLDLECALVAHGAPLTRRRRRAAWPSRRPPRCRRP